MDFGKIDTTPISFTEVETWEIYLWMEGVSRVFIKKSIFLYERKIIHRQQRHWQQPENLSSNNEK
mgnify:CR=1 FL=1